MGRWLYRSIPADDGLKLKSFNYASPGMLELSGQLIALMLLARVARAWIAAGGDFLALWEKVELFFLKRKELRRPKRVTSLDE